MVTAADISALYQEFTEALTEVLVSLGADDLQGLVPPSKSIQNIQNTITFLQSRLHLRGGS